LEFSLSLNILSGNPLNAAKFTGASSGCIDIDGVNHPEGVEYERQNKHFKYRCVNGQEEVSGGQKFYNFGKYSLNINKITACIGSDRTNNARIPVGQTLDIKGYWHKCMKYPNGSVIYTQGRVFFHTFLHKYFVNKSKTGLNQMGNQVSK